MSPDTNGTFRYAAGSMNLISRLSDALNIELAPRRLILPFRKSRYWDLNRTMYVLRQIIDLPPLSSTVRLCEMDAICELAQPGTFILHGVAGSTSVLVLLYASSKRAVECSNLSTMPDGVSDSPSAGYSTSRLRLAHHRSASTYYFQPQHGKEEEIWHCSYLHG